MTRSYPTALEHSRLQWFWPKWWQGIEAFHPSPETLPFMPCLVAKDHPGLIVVNASYVSEWNSPSANNTCSPIIIKLQCCGGLLHINWLLRFPQNSRTKSHSQGTSHSGAHWGCRKHRMQISFHPSTSTRAQCHKECQLVRLGHKQQEQSAISHADTGKRHVVAQVWCHVSELGSRVRWGLRGWVALSTLGH